MARDNGVDTRVLEAGDVGWAGVTPTRHAMSKADANDGKRGPWLKLLDRLHLGFAC